MSKTSNRSIIIPILLIGALISLLFAGAFHGRTIAYADEPVPTTGTLTVNYTYADKYQTFAVGGAEISLYKIASYGTEGGTVSSINAESGYETVDMDILHAGYESLTDQAMLTLSETAEGYVTEKGLKADVTAVTDANGKAVFNELPIGIYLVKQTASSGNAEGFSEFTTHVVSVPLWVTEDDAWSFEVTTNPKASKKEISIRTMALDEQSKTHTISQKSGGRIVDTVSYTGLVPGVEYILSGVLMDKRTQQPIMLDGKEVVATATFTPEKPDGEAEVKYDIDASKLNGTTAVVFEKLYESNQENAVETDKTNVTDRTPVATHEDITDADQTVYIKSPGSSATSKDSSDKAPNVKSGDPFQIGLVVGAAAIAVCILAATRRKKEEA